MTSTLYHRQQGEGEPLLAVHGLFGSNENLGMITRLLKEEYCVYALDLPNHGRSAHSDTMSLKSMADAVVAWMDEQGLASAHFLGHSLGGKVGMEIALRYPERINKLVVADIAPVAYPRRHDDVFAGFAAVNLEAISSRQDADAAMQADVQTTAIRSFLLKNLEQVNGRWQWRVNLPVIAKEYDNFIGANTADQVAFEKPVLFMKGELSAYIQPEHRPEILSRFPQAQVKIINGTEHWLHAEKPEVFAGIVQRFLA